jgi:hypothetical protein
MRKSTLIGVLAILLPGSASAQVAQFVFTSSPQSIAPNAVSEQMSVQAQGSGGSSQSISQTGCVKFESTSVSGQFSSSATSWEAVSALTMNSGTANKNFYYKDASSGAYTITARVGLRPTGETRTCATLLSAGEFPAIQWSASQGITVTGGASTGTSSSSPAPVSTEAQAPSQSQTTSGVVSSYTPPPEPTMFADAGADRVVIVGADTEFRGRAYNKSKEVVPNARLSWNFGDGSTAEGASVMHHFEYPGTYAAVLSVTQQMESVSDRIVVRAEPAKLGFFVLADGSVTIENRAGRELDLSRWVVHAFNRDFLLPEHSIIFADTTLRISPKTLGFFAGAEAELRYPNGSTALPANRTAGETVSRAVPLPAPAPAPAEIPRAERARSIPADTAVEEAAEDSGASVETIAPSADVPLTKQAAAVSVFSGGYWWLAMGVLATVFALGAMTLRRILGAQWRIVEETE